MYFSSKITHSVVNFLSSKGCSLEPLYELTEISPDQLRDPSGWLLAYQVEEFLKLIEAEYCSQFHGVNFVESIGHASNSLRAWGVLDSVLRMMASPKDIFAQPQRFISYFVSPEPPMMNISRSDSAISLDIPISDEEYPNVTTYLKAALEALPTFVGAEMARVTWFGTRLTVNWAQHQDSLFDKDEEKPNYKPELMQSVVRSLEEAERNLEKKDNQIRGMEDELQRLKSRLNRAQAFEGDPRLLINKEEWAAQAATAIETPLCEMQANFMKLGDYMARAQQLVTLIASVGPKNVQMKEAMRRMDWDFIRSEYPKVIQEGIDQIHHMKDAVNHLDMEIPQVETKEENRVQMNLNLVIEQAIESARTQIPNRVEIDSMLFLDRPVDVFPDQMKHAIVRVLSHAAQRIKKEGKIRVVTRPRGNRAEIEITDNGRTLRSSLLEKEGALGVADSIVKLHQGNMTFLKGVEQGATCIIDLPMEQLSSIDL